VDYLIDTNILVICSRNSELANQIEADLQLFSGEHNVAISAVTIGELNSLMQRNRYGERRKNDIDGILNKLFKIDINIREILDLYGKIDAYSQGKLFDTSVDFTARNMGKNDIWIAATASAYDMALVTTDKDFDHLNNEYLSLNFIDIENYRN